MFEVRSRLGSHLEDEEFLGWREWGSEVVEERSVGDQVGRSESDEVEA